MITREVRQLYRAPCLGDEGSVRHRDIVR